MPSLSLAQRIAHALLDADAVGFSPQQPVTFKSGIVSPVYVDNRRLPYHPEQWHQIIEALRETIARQRLTFDVIAGVAVGGIPHSAALSYTLRVPSVFVRTEAKGHGAKRQIEGGSVSGRRVLLIEDMVTTGGSSLDAVTALRDASAEVANVLAIVSYGFAPALAAFSAAGLTLHTLTHFDAILWAAVVQARCTPEEAAIIQDWFTDPYGWAQRRQGQRIDDERH